MTCLSEIAAGGEEARPTQKDIPKSGEALGQTRASAAHKMAGSHGFRPTMKRDIRGAGS
jgi:hypothetical protein